MNYWLVFFVIVFVWVLVYFGTHRRVKINVWAGTLIYGILRTLFNVGMWFGSICATLFSKKSETRLPERPQTAESVSDILTVHPSLTQPMECIIGYNKKRPIKVNFANHHTLIAASTGGGKSNLLNGILIQLFGKGAIFRDTCDVYLIDLKGDERDYLRHWSPLLAGYATYSENELDDAIAVLNLIVDRIMSRQHGKHILLIIDEVAVLTHHSLDRHKMRESIALLTRILSQLRTYGSVIMSAQYPKFDVIPTPIRGNAPRKIMFMVDSRDQAGTILGVRPSESELPVQIGEFLIKEPGTRGFQRGKSMLVDVPREIDQVVFGQITDHLSEPRLKIFHELSSSLLPGASIPGVQRMAASYENISQADLMGWYRNYALAGAFAPPERKGQPYKLAVDWQTGIQLIKTYIASGQWQEQPEAFLDE